MAVFFWLYFDALLLPAAIAVFSVPGLVAGIGLLQHKTWSRGFAIIMAILNLFTFPHGTGIGVYSLAVLFDPETRNLFSARIVSPGER